MICPNLSDPKVRGDFNKIADAIGEANAYTLWNKLEGKSLFDTEEYRNILGSVNENSEDVSNEAIKKAYKLLVTNTDPQAVDYQLKVIGALTSIIDDRKTIRVNTKDNPYIEENFRKLLWGKGVKDNQIDFIFNYMKGNGLTEISTIDLISELYANMSFTVNVDIATKKTNSYEALKRVGNEFILKDNNYKSEHIPKTLKSKYYKNGNEISYDEYLKAKAEKQKEFESVVPTQEYSTLSVPGGANYTENDISTPLIEPSIKSHASFATNNSIGWFRSDERRINELTNKGNWITSITEVPNEFYYNNGEIRIWKDRDGNWNEESRYIEEQDVIWKYNQSLGNTISKTEVTKTRRILELQSDLFQKGRGKKDLINRDNITLSPEADYFTINNRKYQSDKATNEYWYIENNETLNPIFITKQEFNIAKNNAITANEFTKLTDNQFLQLLNEANSWITFFIKSVIQDSARKGYEKVRFPNGETAAKVEGHETLANEIKSIDIELDRLNKLLKNREEFKPFKELDMFIYGDVAYKKYDNEWFIRRGNGLPLMKVTTEEAKHKYNSINSEILAAKKDINRLEDRKNELKSQGIEKLKPIEAFYEVRIKNTLVKIYGEKNVKFVRDEYGNGWFEVNIVENHLDTIQLSKELGITEQYPATEKYTNEVSRKLKSTFSKLGIDVEVRPNSSLESNARVFEKDGKKIIEFNPNKVKTDSIFHEFGHIYIDLIEDQDFIKAGIDQLRGTELWDKIEKLYPELSGVALGKEVLTTAIGIKASKIFKDSNKAKTFKFWLNKLFMKIKKLLGLSRDDIAEQLARDLVRGDLTKRLNYYAKVAEQHQRDYDVAAMLGKASNFLKDKINMLRTTERQYRNDPRSNRYVKDTKAVLEQLEVVLEKRGLLQQYQAIGISLERDRVLLSQLEKRVAKLKEEYIYKKVQLDKVSREEFLHFARTMYNLNTFIDSFTPIEGLSYVEEEQLEGMEEDEVQMIKDINALIKEVKTTDVPRLNNLKISFEALRPKFASYIISYSTDPGITDAEAEAMKMFTTGLMDENKKQMVFDAMFDSNNVFAANLIKFIRENENYAKDEAEQIKREFTRLEEEFRTAGFTVDDISRDGRLFQQYDVSSFFDDLKELKTKAEKKAFYNEHTIKNYAGDLETVKEEHKEKLSEVEYNNWYERNFREDYEGKEVLVVGGDLLGLSDDYVTDDWKSLQTSNIKKNFHKYMVDTMKYLTLYVNKAVQKEGYFPAVPKVAAKYDRKASELELTNTSGETVFQIPFKYLGFIVSESPIPIPVRLPEETDEDYESRAVKQLEDEGYGKFDNINQVKSTNKEKAEANKKKHNDNREKRLDIIMPLFIDSAMTHKYRSQIEDAVLMSLAVLKESKILKLNGYKQQLKDFWKVDQGGNRELRAIEGSQSNVYKHLQKEIEMKFYDKFVDPRRMDKQLKFLKTYSSWLGIGLNIHSAVKNITFGEYMTIAEGLANVHMNVNDLRKARRRYLKSVTSYVADDLKRKGGDRSASTFESALIRHFNIIESYDDFLERDKVANASINKLYRASSSLGFGMQGAGEHLLHNTTLFSMLESNRIINGKALSEMQYIELMIEKENLKVDKKDVILARDISGGKLTGKAKQDLLDKIAKMKERRKELAKEFTKYPKFIDVLEFEEEEGKRFKRGFIKVKEVDGKPIINQREINLFKEKVVGVNHKIHGIYNRMDKGIIENTMPGQNLMQFKHWLIPGWNKRWGSRGGIHRIDQFWNERREEYDIGDAKSLLKLFTTPYKIMKEENGIERANAYNTLVLMLKSMRELMTNYKVYYGMLSPQERAGIRRQFAHMLSTIGVIALSSMLLSLRGDDDDDKKNMFTNFLLYQLDASRVELMTYSPAYGWFNEGLKMLRRPTAGIGIMVNGYKTARALLEYPFQDDEDRIFKAGVNKGQVKFISYGTRLVPFATQIDRILELENDQSAISYKMIQ
jgi:hypothetical protein